MKRALLVTCMLAGMVSGARGSAQVAEPEPYGSWMRLPAAEWPKLALVNQIAYVGERHPVAGCAFLLEVEDEVLAATAKHVLTYFKSPAMDSVDFRGTLKRWTMFPKDRPTAVAVVDELVNTDSEESLEGIPCDRDWLLFTLAQRSEELQPLRLRSTPLRKGEPVYVVGWRYTDTKCPQVVYEGEYVRTEEDAVAITVEKLIDNTVPGLSGAPVIDAEGYVIGIMSRGKGEIQRLSPVAYPLAFLKRRADGG